MTQSLTQAPPRLNKYSTGTKMSPEKVTATQNQQVTFNVTADKQEEIHLHGYDIKFEVGGAGQTVTHSFKADKTGSFVGSWKNAMKKANEVRPRSTR